ncbi:MULTISPECIES: hypothetical protein [unclassified Paludibacterium]|uniref:hypothetical protein n=1 Tax=unclassified Paludibacterium TaxID=2618429 RepID=UPI001C046BB1|nr:hypothetical protein [Paludibacterium sp. B53371]BEV70882.1 hypothetical protein THUN1379_03640 [Paludibacterium sp. THUN1379]
MDFPIVPGSPASLTLMPSSHASDLAGVAATPGYQGDPPDHAGLMPGAGLSLAQMGVVSSVPSVPAAMRGPAPVQAAADNPASGTEGESDGFAQLQQQFRQAALMAQWRLSPRVASGRAGLEAAFASASAASPSSLIARA